MEEKKNEEKEKLQLDQNFWKTNIKILEDTRLYLKVGRGMNFCLLFFCGAPNLPSQKSIYYFAE